jgi:hypothetical protein
MAKGASINTDFSDFNESDFTVAAGKVVSSITQYAIDFTFITIPISVLKDEMVIYNKTITTPIYPSKAANLKASRKRAQRTLKTNGNIINTTANGDEVLMKKSAYPMQKPDEAQKQLPKTVLTIEANGIVGELEYSISRIDEQKIKYGMMYTDAENPDNDPSNWKFYYCGSREGTMVDMESGKDFKFVSFAMGTVEKLTYSEVVYAKAK